MLSETLSKFIKSYNYANEGIYHALKTQNSFRIQVFFAILSIIFAVIFEFDRFEWIILTLTICSVLSAELLNTVIETIVDLYTVEYHEKAKLAKDLSAGVVLIVCLFSVAIGILLYTPHIVGFFH